MDLVLMASGRAKRFGSNKLLEDLCGKKVYEYSRDMYADINEIDRKVIVSAYDEILESSKDKGFICIKNNENYKGISSSIKLGLLNLGFSKENNYKSDNDGIIFAVCDQPLLNGDTVRQFIKYYQKFQKGIACVRHGEEIGNPKIFSYKYIKELLEIDGDVGGRQIIKEYTDDILYFDIEDRAELFDIDNRDDLEYIKKLLSDKNHAKYKS